MFELESFDGVRKITWSQLRPGMVLLSDITINGSVPYELRNFPVITRQLYAEVTERYHLLPNREVLVALPRRYDEAGRFVQSLREAAETADTMNRLRATFFDTRAALISTLPPLPGAPPGTSPAAAIASAAIEHDHLVLNRYASLGASFTLPADQDAIPSFFHAQSLDLTLAAILAGKADTLFRFPQDEPVLLHLVVDFSLSMFNRGRMEHVIDSFKLFLATLGSVLKNTKIQFYVFSDTCKPVRFPFSLKELPARDTNYTSFIKKVLHHRDKTVRNKLILFTDGRPTDLAESREIMALLKKNQVDYTQIIFNLSEEYDEVLDNPPDGIDIVDNIAVGCDHLTSRPTTPAERAERRLEDLTTFTDLAERAGGNQIVMNIDRAMRFVAVEVYDRYLGLLTLANVRRWTPPGM